MAKRSTASRPAEPPAPISLDEVRDNFLAGFAWPAETPDAAKVLAVEAVTGFAAHVAAQAADLVRPAPAEAPPGAAAPDGMVTVVVTGPREGRYRGGRYFTDTASAPFAVTADELAQLRADPRLVVTGAR